MTTAARTAADFDALPTGALILAIELRDAARRDYRVRTAWQKLGREWVNLDPTDRNNGEETKPAGYLENLLTGFGSRNAAPGVALVFGAGRTVDAFDAEKLPPRSLVCIGELDEWSAEVYHHEGGGRFTHMNPADPDDGDYPYTTAQMFAAAGEAGVHVLYTPGDEDPHL